MKHYGITARRMLLLLALVVPSVAAGCARATSRSSGTQAAAAVLRVIDGDTLVVEARGSAMHVRIAGIDAPERGQPGYAEATRALESLVVGKALVLDWSGITGRQKVFGVPVDPFGRVLARVRVGELDVGQWMLDHGYAVQWMERRTREPQGRMPMTPETGGGGESE